MISLAIETLASVRRAITDRLARSKARSLAVPRSARRRPTDGRTLDLTFPARGGPEPQRSLLRLGCRAHLASSVDVAEHGVHRRDDRHRVGDEPTAHHVRQALDVHERRSPDVQPVRARAAVAGDVAAELAARALHRDVDLAL